LPQLDGLRGVAIAFVLFGHVVQFSLHRLITIGNSLAQLGVLLFFVLSGFLITTLITDEKQSSGNVNLTQFYWRRILRLAPAFLLFMAAVIWLMLMHRIPRIPNYEIIACFLYVRNIFGRSEALAHLWSLSLEEQFYIVWPPLVKLFDSNRLLAISVVVTIAMCLWRGLAIFINLFDYNLGIYYIRPYFRFDSILIGCCLALCLKYKPVVGRQLQNMQKLIPTFVVWALVIAWSVIGQSLSRPLYISVQMLGVTWVLFRAVTGKSFRVLASWPLKSLGKISYSLYLWQQIFLVTLHPGWGIVSKFPINVIACFLAATASYFGIERPFLRLKNKRQSKLNALAIAE